MPPWTKTQLESLLANMQITARDAVREKGTAAAALGLLDPAVAEDVILEAMISYPVLVNRPIVVTPKGAKLCRPSEIALGLLDRQQPDFTKEDGEIVRSAGQGRLILAPHHASPFNLASALSSLA